VYRRLTMPSLRRCACKLPSYSNATDSIRPIAGIHRLDLGFLFAVIGVYTVSSGVIPRWTTRDSQLDVA
jgi:hypothetical protein